MTLSKHTGNYITLHYIKMKDILYSRAFRSTLVVILYSCHVGVEVCGSKKEKKEKTMEQINCDTMKMLHKLGGHFYFFRGARGLPQLSAKVCREGEALQVYFHAGRNSAQCHGPQLQCWPGTCNYP